MLEALLSNIAVPGIEIRALAAVLFTSVAAYYDISNKKWVPDWSAYLAVALAALVNIVFFTPDVFVQALAYGAAIFAATHVLYKLGQLGGADVYIMASIAATVPHLQQPLLSAPQDVPYPFIFSVLIPTGIAFVLHMLLRFIPYISRQIAQGKLKFSKQKIAEGALLFGAVAFFILAITSLPIALPAAYIAILSFLSVSLLFFSLFKHEIKASMVETVPSQKLCEEDVLALDSMDPALVRRLSLHALMDKKEIAAIRKAKIKALPVYTGMPFFLPYVLAGLLFTLIFGDLFFLLF